MEVLKKLYQEEIGTPLPERIEQALGRDYVEITGVDGELIGSPIALSEQYLAQGHIRGFCDSAPPGHVLTGFCGHGVNSYAFYFCLVDSWRRIYFRLPYGGVYMDNEKMARCIREFLCRYFLFEDSIAGKVTSFIAIESMWYGDYQIVLLDGRSVSHKGSLFEAPDFETALAFAQ